MVACVCVLGTGRENGVGGGKKTKIESDKKRELLWKADRHKRLSNCRWKSVNEE